MLVGLGLFGRKDFAVELLRLSTSDLARSWLSGCIGCIAGIEASWII